MFLRLRIRNRRHPKGSPIHLPAVTSSAFLRGLALRLLNLLHAVIGGALKEGNTDTHTHYLYGLRSTAPQIYLALLTCALFLFLSPSALGSQFEKLGRVGEWEIGGTDDQCQASKQLDPSYGLSQFAIGIARKGTYLHFQNLSWWLPSTRTNMMRVKILFDGSIALRTEALLIRQVGAFQVFLWLTEMPEEVFWKRFLGARSLSVTGKFKPGRAVIELKDTEKIPPLLKDCAQRYLPGVELPF